MRSGSSPPTRGTLLRQRRLGAPVRFIPAYAGNTSSARSPRLCNAVHPRLRGEHAKGSRSMPEMPGSSPPTRGTLDQPGQGDLAPRFIPAYAGNTCHALAAARGSPVHPRLRGEHSLAMMGIGFTAGSSPPTRGTLQAIPPEDRPRRFIPAYAGNTISPWPLPGMASVHPRLRGEHSSTGPVTQ